MLNLMHDQYRSTEILIKFNVFKKRTRSYGFVVLVRLCSVTQEPPLGLRKLVQKAWVVKASPRGIS